MMHLMRHPNVVATAIGRYRIRKTDSWPGDKKKHHGTGVRRLDNSEMRPYSGPCILVFVSKLLAVLWESAWNGEHNVTRKSSLTKKEAMDIVKDPDFIPSVTIGQIGALLKKP
jgi:hypothetical protein